MKKIILLMFIIFLMLIVGCRHQEIKEGQVYIVEDSDYLKENNKDILQIEGRIPFQKYHNDNFWAQREPGNILLTISPDGQEIYFMERLEFAGSEQVILGDPGDRVRIIRENLETAEKKIVAANIPFVTKTLWNGSGYKVAFGGGGRLTIYDVQKEKLIMEEKLAQETIINFFWSPDNDNKLYSEQPELANGSIYYVDSLKVTEAYETREESYYKGRLDANYYYGTQWDLVSGGINTVILEKHGDVVKNVIPGRFRDSYQRALVAVGDQGFGLYYIKDINVPEEVIVLTEDYVYDVKFVTDGKIAFTTKKQDYKDNFFYLHLVDSNGKLKNKFEVFGASISLMPDGTTGYVNGPGWQQVDFVAEKLLQPNTEISEPAEHNDKTEICQTLRGAMTTLYDYQLKGDKNQTGLKNFFTNTDKPHQWAYTDMELIFQQDVPNPVHTYMMKIKLKKFETNFFHDNVSLIIGVELKTPNGEAENLDYALELIKSEGNWLVTGFSTFPTSLERQEIEKVVGETIAAIQKGELFSDRFLPAEVEVGQVQFWRSGINHLATTAQSANLVKVLLQSENNGQKELFELTIEKSVQDSWKPSELKRLK
ncbi:MAG TPA: hypothetical protein GX699_06955 [Firmicutes bacterium]|nr:hypothetical protein [Bacillota bacterium]